MEPKEVLERYGSLRPRTLSSVAAMLADAGREFDAELHRDAVATHEIAEDPDGWFAPACAQALHWSLHAKAEDDSREGWSKYVQRVLRFLSGDRRALATLRNRHSRRYGPQGLERALNGYAAIRSLRPDLTSLAPATPAATRKNQDDLVAWLQGAGQGRAPGIGAWLAFAPHKILCLLRRAWWTLPEINSVVQPLGGAVAAGMRRLIKDRIIDDPGFLGRYAREEDPGPDSLTDVYLAQASHALLARVASTNTLHINGGLWLLGHPRA